MTPTSAIQRSRWYHDKNRKRMNTWGFSVVLLSGWCTMAVGWLKAKQVSRGFPSADGLHVNLPHRQSPNQGKGCVNPVTLQCFCCRNTDCGCELWSQEPQRIVHSETNMYHTHSWCVLTNPQLSVWQHVEEQTPHDHIIKQKLTRKLYKTNLSVSGVKSCCV